MKKYLTTILLLVSLTGPAFSANAANPDAADIAPGYSYPAKHHFAVKDTVGYCSVIDAGAPASGLKLLGDKGGYPTIKAAQKAFDSTCKGTVERDA